MIRRIVMVVCLMVSLAFAAFWYLSHRRADLCWYRQRHPLACMVYGQQGQLRISVWYSGVSPRSAVTQERQFLNFGSKVAINATPLNTINHLRRICVPLWLPSCFFFSSFVFLLIRGPIRTMWRLRHNLCLRCGYSLDGLTEPRCPECGSEVEPFVEVPQLGES